MKTKELLFALFAFGLFFGSCSTSQKHVAFNTGGWKENVDPSSVRTHINNETNVNTELQPTTKNSATLMSSEANNEIETSTATNLDETQLISQESISPNNTAVKTSEILSEAKKLNFIQRKMIKPLQKKIANVVEKAKIVNRSGSGSGSGMSIASLVLGILGLFILGWLFGTLAIIFGAIGMGRDGRGMAIAGLVLGIIDVLISVIFILAVLASI